MEEGGLVISGNLQEISSRRNSLNLCPHIIQICILTQKMYWTDARQTKMFHFLQFHITPPPSYYDIRLYQENTTIVNRTDIKSKSLKENQSHRINFVKIKHHCDAKVLYRMFKRAIGVKNMYMIELIMKIIVFVSEKCER